MSDDKTLDDYEVGYGKPPKNTQFRKGVSGNPRGRPKKSLDFDHELIRESESFMTVTENGRPKRISKHEVVVKQLMKQAMTEALKPNEPILAFANKHSRGSLWPQQPSPTTPEETSPLRT